jgi:hypothetical protein
MYPLYHPALLREYLSFGEFKKLCKMLTLLHAQLIQNKASPTPKVLHLSDEDRK